MCCQPFSIQRQFIRAKQKVKSHSSQCHNSPHPFNHRFPDVPHNSQIFSNCPAIFFFVHLIGRSVTLFSSILVLFLIILQVIRFTYITICYLTEITHCSMYFLSDYTYLLYKSTDVAESNCSPSNPLALHGRFSSSTEVKWCS